MPVVVAVGVALIVWSVVLCIVFASVLRRRGEPASRALVALGRRPTLWLGLTLIVADIDPVVAGVLIVVFVVFALFFIARRTRGRVR